MRRVKLPQPNFKRLASTVTRSDAALARGVSRLTSSGAIQLLQLIAALSIFVVVIRWYIEAPSRKQQAHYQAWQVITSAERHGGSGGRTQALEDLNNDGEPLDGINLTGAYLRRVHLERASLWNARLDSADLVSSNFTGAQLVFVSMRRADVTGGDFRCANMLGAKLEGAFFESSDLREADLITANLSHTILRNADLRGAILRHADLTGAVMSGVDLRAADLRYANLSGVIGLDRVSLQHSNVFGVVADSDVAAEIAALRSDSAIFEEDAPATGWHGPILFRRDAEKFCRRYPRVMSQ
jgi:uncharacterized protein YjbI with pentapeptide repeats